MSLKTLRSGDPAGAAIVFVHGFSGGAESTWADFPGDLEAEAALGDWSIHSFGYDSNLRVDLIGIWSADPDIARIALELATDLGKGALQSARAVCLVAHSMGGLVVQRALLDTPALRQRVSHVFLFGTPSGGLVKASWVRILKPQLRDMDSDGIFIRTLRRDWSAAFDRSRPFQFFTIAGSRDQFVPPESSLEPFPRQRYADSWCVVPGDHLQIVKPASPDSLSVRVVVNALRGQSAPAGPWNAAAMAIQSRDFVRAVELLEPSADQLDADGIGELALALEGCGRTADALALLERHQDAGTDVLGILAGRLKRRWLLSRIAADGEHALQLYQDGLRVSTVGADHAQALYHGINVAFMQLALHKDLAKARAIAQEVLTNCALAQANELAPNRKWRLATEGEAALLLGNSRSALDAYAAAVAPGMGVTPRELQSMYQQAVYVAELVGDSTVRGRLEAIFRPGDAVP